MTRRKPEQIVKLLRKADEELAKGKAVEDNAVKSKSARLRIIGGNASMATCKWRTLND